MRPYKKGGVPASQDEIDDDAVITIPIPVVGRNIVISFDPTLDPYEFRLVP